MGDFTDCERNKLCIHPMPRRLQASIFMGGAPKIFFRKGAILWANNCEKMTMYGKKERD